MPETWKDKSVLVVGGTGFIGRHLVDACLNEDADVTVASRHAVAVGEKRCKTVICDLTRANTLEGICRGQEIVFHLGGHAHAMDQIDGKSAEINRRTTVEGTRELVRQSLEAGIHRFIFFSSVKAMGEGSETCLGESAVCQPVTAYGHAKREAEQIVLDAAKLGLPVVVLRLPMVYGPGAKGNLPRMIRAIARGRFPPLPETENKRSLVDVRDVVRAAMLAAVDPVAAGQTYIVTDGRIYSTRQIYEWICAALHRPVSRWTMPLAFLRAVARVGDTIGRFRGRRFVLDTDSLGKLIGSACYRSEKICRELKFRPIYMLESSLPEMVTQIGKKGSIL